MIFPKIIPLINVSHSCSYFPRNVVCSRQPPCPDLMELQHPGLLRSSSVPSSPQSTSSTSVNVSQPGGRWALRFLHRNLRQGPSVVLGCGTMACAVLRSAGCSHTPERPRSPPVGTAGTEFYSSLLSLSTFFLDKIYPFAVSFTFPNGKLRPNQCVSDFMYCKYQCVKQK